MKQEPGNDGFYPAKLQQYAVKQNTTMKNASKLSPGKRVSAEQIARMAERPINVSRFFSNTGRMMRPMPRVNVDFESPNVEESSKSSQKD